MSDIAIRVQNITKAYQGSKRLGSGLLIFISDPEGELRSKRGYLRDE